MSSLIKIYFRNLFVFYFLSINIILAQPTATGQEDTSAKIDVIPENAITIQDFEKAANPQRLVKKIDVETENFKIEISAKGGIISSFRHRNEQNELKNNVQLADNGPFRFEFYKTPYSLKLLHETEYLLNQTKTDNFIEVTAKANMNMKSKGKLYPTVVTKRYRFYQKMHYWQYFWDVQNLSNQDIVIEEIYFINGRPIGPKSNSDSSREEASFYNFYFANDSFESISTVGFGLGCSSDQSDSYVNSEIEFFGTSSRFMIMVLQPQNKTSGLYIFQKAKEAHVEFKSIFIPAKSKKTLDFIAYTGPKENETVNISSAMKLQNPFLKQIHKKLYEAFNFGITGPIRDLIVKILDWLYLIIPNYGWGIIIFSLLFKIIFFPLNQKQANSMKKMSTLQPLIKEINEKYKNNPQEKQKRTMSLYQQHKVNPLSGCLPIVVQIPIFIALYTAFSDSYHLWKSPFIEGWINDLSEPDTVYVFEDTIPIIGSFNVNILPMIMGVTQFAQSKFMNIGMGGDNSAQQKIMQLMPLILIFFFWNMPSGVVLYWTVQNILTIMQQAYTDFKGKPKEKPKE